MTILEEAIAGAGVDPRELHAKLMAGRQDDTVRLAQAFEEAGTVARDAYERGRRAHGAIAGGFLNNGGPVLDAGAQDAQAWRLLGQGGQDMHDVAEMLRRSVRALDDAQAASTAVTDRMVVDLNAVASAFTLNMRTGGLQSDRPQFVSRAVEIVKAAAAEIRRITETYDGVLTRDGAQLAGRGYAGAPVAPGDRFSPDAARRDAERLRAALADPDAKDVLLDDATTTLQALDAQVRAGHPLTAEQQRYITEFANIAGTDALVALPGLADTGVQQGADRAEAAVAGTLERADQPRARRHRGRRRAPRGAAHPHRRPPVRRGRPRTPHGPGPPARGPAPVRGGEPAARRDLRPARRPVLGHRGPAGDQDLAAHRAGPGPAALPAAARLQHRRLPPRAGGGGARLVAAADQRVPQPGRGADPAAGRRHPQVAAGHPARRRDRGRGAARPGDGAGRARRGIRPGRRGRRRDGREGERPGRRRGAHRRRPGPLRLARARSARARRSATRSPASWSTTSTRSAATATPPSTSSRPPGSSRASTAGSAWAGRTRRTCSRSSGPAAPTTVPMPTSSGCTWPRGSSPSTRSRRRRSARRTPARLSARPAA